MQLLYVNENCIFLLIKRHACINPSNLDESNNTHSTVVILVDHKDSRETMGGRKKQFIDKKHAVKFQLVHRSQKDPLFLDERLGEHVLMPVDPDTSPDLVALVNGINLNDKNNNKVSRQEEIERQRLEQHKYGIYFDDDYNYLQHLKEVDDEIRLDGADLDEEKLDVLSKPKPKLQLPSSVFASAYEEDVGYFNMNAPDNDPKINWDPDIVEILDEETNYDFNNPDNQMDDDFFLKAQENVQVGDL
jgi:protein LTV1